uniref:Uncharacterized protein n=1 Tax=Triticum urartu TaxID=4572 RepID=A0A8R7V8X8_TRIUA
MDFGTTTLGRHLSSHLLVSSKFHDLELERQIRPPTPRRWRRLQLVLESHGWLRGGREVPSPASRAKPSCWWLERCRQRRAPVSVGAWQREHWCR